MAQVFVSGQINDLSYVRAVQAQFVASGHVITHDWTRIETGNKMLTGRQAKFDNPDEASKRANADMTGVVDCDVYVICTNNEDMGKGMYVELGGALALNVATGVPKVYLLGDRKHATIFYFHPSILLRETVDEIIKEITA